MVLGAILEIPWWATLGLPIKKMRVTHDCARHVITLLALIIGVTGFPTSNSVIFAAQKPQIQRNMVDLGSLLGSVEPTTVVLGLGVAGAAVNFASYWKLQFETARICGGVPRGAIVTEMDAQDGKNIFYLPEGVDYTGVMLSSQQNKEKAAINEQLILESIGKANGQGGSRRHGKMRSKSQDIKPRSQDVVLSIGAIGRCAGQDRTIVVKEAFRLLKPGGLFVFLEPGGDDVLQLLETFFSKEITETIVPSDSKRGKKSQQEASALAAGRDEGPAEDAAAFAAVVAVVAEDIASSGGGVPKLRRVKPGIVSTPVSVPFRNFIQGICVRS